RNVIKSAYRLNWRLATRSTMLTATPLRNKAAHLPIKALRFSGRSLFAGLTSSMAATSVRPFSASYTRTSYSSSSGAAVSMATLGAPGAHTAVATPPWWSGLRMTRGDIDLDLRAGVDARRRDEAGRELLAELVDNDHRPPWSSSQEAYVVGGGRK